MDTEDISSLGESNIEKIVVRLNLPRRDDPSIDAAGAALKTLVSDGSISADELHALSATAERLNAFVFGTPPQAEYAREIEMWTYQARVLRIDPDMISRMLSIADRVGPMTVLPNGQVREAVWRSMIERAAKGLAPIPDEARPLAWARTIWHIMYFAEPNIVTMPLFLSLTDALAHVRHEIYSLANSSAPPDPLPHT